MQAMPAARTWRFRRTKGNPRTATETKWAGMTDLDLFILEFSIIFPDRQGCENTNRQFSFILAGNNVLEP